MEFTVQIPDYLAKSMGADGGDLSRRALEALALEEFKGGHITKPEEDLDQELEGLRRLGIC
jgi:hypothetical protein